jgi:hypothetical protein
MIVVQHSDSQGAIELVCDKEGLTLLIQHLLWLQDQQPPDHFHFFTPSWGGSELCGEPQSDGATVYEHLRVQLLPD